MTTRNQAAELFAQMVFETGYQEGIKAAGIADIVEPLRTNEETRRRAGEMASRLDDEDRECLRFLLHDAVEAALFHVLVDLDGDSVGYHEINGKKVEFTLGLRVFENETGDKEEGAVVQEIAIAPTTKGEDLHDLFLGLVDKVVDRNP